MLVLRMIEERFHRDVEDRPIREGRTPPELIRPGEIEYKRCPYAGSRQDHAKPMNVSALRQTTAHWDEILGTLGFLREAYATARGGFAGDPLDLWRVSQLGSSLPWFYILRGQPAPADAAALAKATQGVGLWAQAVLVRMIAQRWQPPILTAPAVLELAELSGTLVGATEVCSAPDKMLLKFFEVLTDRQTPGASDLEANAVLRFGAHYQGLKLWMWIYYLARRFLYADLAVVLGDPPELRALRDAPCEPSDCLLVEPDDLAALPLERRTEWFRMLAGFVVPFAPDGSDVMLRNAAEILATWMGTSFATDPLVAELGAPLARPLATYLQLDTLFAAVVTHLELQFRAVLGTGEGSPVADASRRDRLLGSSPRAYLATLSPTLGPRSTP